jgi:hypothetical protein
MQCTIGGWYDDVHVSGTVGAFEVWDERLSAHAGGGYLRIRARHLPGM